MDLNCDVGEAYGKVAPFDEKIMMFLSSCNIACGFHSGDPLTIERTILMALKHKVAIGAHPSYPDLQGFGRRAMQLSKAELFACVRYQVAALKGMTEALGGRLCHVKAHGALYNMAAKNLNLATDFIDAVKSIDSDLKIFGPPKSQLQVAAQTLKMDFVCEVFADRRYEYDLSLRSRHLDYAVITDETEVLEQVRLMVLKKQVQTFEGNVYPIQAETICLHSDTEGAINLAKKIYQLLTQHEINISAP